MNRSELPFASGVRRAVIFEFSTLSSYPPFFAVEVQLNFYYTIDKSKQNFFFSSFAIFILQLSHFHISFSFYEQRDLINGNIQLNLYVYVDLMEGRIEYEYNDRKCPFEETNAYGRKL